MHPSPLEVLMVTTLAHMNDPSSVRDIPMLSTDQMVVTTNDLPKQQLHDITKPREIVTTSSPSHACMDMKMDDEDEQHQHQQHYQNKNFARPNLVQQRTQGNTPTNHPLSILSSSSSNNNNNNNTKNSVRFNSVSIRVYDQCLGDHPCCSDGLPLSLDWTYTETSTIDIDTYEKTKQGNQSSSSSSINSRSSLQSLRLNGHERKCILEKLPSYQKRKMLGCRMDRDQSSFHLGATAGINEEENNLCFQSFTNLDDLFTVSLDASSDTSSLGCSNDNDDDDSCLVGKDLHDVFDVEMMDTTTSSGGGGINVGSTISCRDKSSISSRGGSIDNNDMTLLLVPSLNENEATISSMSSSSSSESNNHSKIITETEEKEQLSPPPPSSSSLDWKRAERRHYREAQGFVRRRVNHEFFTPPTAKSCRNKDTSVGLFLEN